MLTQGVGCVEVVELLLGANADPNVVTKNGRSALHVASEVGVFKSVGAAILEQYGSLRCAQKAKRRVVRKNIQFLNHIWDHIYLILFGIVL